MRRGLDWKTGKRTNLKEHTCMCFSRFYSLLKNFNSRRIFRTVLENILHLIALNIKYKQVWKHPNAQPKHGCCSVYWRDRRHFRNFRNSLKREEREAVSSLRCWGCGSLLSHLSFIPIRVAQISRSGPGNKWNSFVQWPMTLSEKSGR